MATIGERLKELRSGKGKTLVQMSNETGLGVSAIGNYENDFRVPRRKAMETLTDYFNVDTDYLLGKTNVRRAVNLTGIFEEGVRQGEEKVRKSLMLRTIPIFSRLSCGTGEWVDEVPSDQMTIPEGLAVQGRYYFANQADGDSMEPGISNGDYLVFEQVDQIDSGKIGSFSLNGEYYCKRLKCYPDGSCWLISDNPEYPPIPIRPEDDFRTLGLYKLKLSKEQ